MPRPAVIQFSSPGRIGTSVPRLVPVHDLAVEQIGDGRQADVGMRPHIHAGRRRGTRRPHLVEEEKGPDHLPLRRGQRSPHLEAAEVTGAGHDHRLDGVAGELDRQAAVFGGVASS